MWASFLLCLNAVVPSFIIIVLGMIVRRLSSLEDQEQKRFNGIAYNVFLSAMVFYSITNAGVRASFRPGLIAMAFALILAEFALACFFVCRGEKSPDKRGVMIQSLVRGNYVMLGLPLVLSLYGSRASGPAMILVALAAPLYNLLSIAVLAYFNAKRFSLRELVQSILTDPCTLAALAAILMSLWGVCLPEMLLTAVESLSAAASPLMLLLLGAGILPGRINLKDRRVWSCTLGKLVAAPAVAMAVAVAAGFRGLELVILMAIFASPSGVSCYTMTQKHGGDAELAAELVMTTTAVACVTMVALLLTLQTLGLV